jgi:hypothetical protein
MAQGGVPFKVMCNVWATLPALAHIRMVCREVPISKMSRAGMPLVGVKAK